MDFDVIIIGSGPSGGMAAIASAKAGLSVAIFEKEPLPRRKVCAGGLVKRAVQLLPKDLDFPIESQCDSLALQLHNPDTSFHADSDNIVTMVNRPDFDYSLIKYAMKDGAKVFDQTAIKQIKPHSNHVEVATSSQTYSASYLILAEGANARLANTLWQDDRILIPAIESEIMLSPEQLAAFKGVARFDFDVIPSGYGWVFPKHDHVSVGIANFSKKSGQLQKLFDTYKEMVGLAEGYTERNRKGFIIPIKPRKPPYMKQRIMLVGDAAGFADPITAEGFTYALKSGLEAGKAMVAGKNPEEISSLYHAGIDEDINQELNIAAKISKPFYFSKTIRKVVFKRYGERLCHSMVGFLEGKRSYRLAAKNNSLILKFFKGAA